MAKMIAHSKNYKPAMSFKQRLNLLVNGCPKKHNLDLKFL